jgi:hypothetical protein
MVAAKAGAMDVSTAVYLAVDWGLTRAFDSAVRRDYKTAVSWAPTMVAPQADGSEGGWVAPTAPA